ncbi:hypothetical protein [Nonomuraea sp. GTA35]|uniref:hypothetical protein n=1 Tax=Nonomuraea sp. GTA35 TaxID=1676746 RepID=UPI0035C0E40C
MTLMATETKTATSKTLGQQLADELRRQFRIGTRTRWSTMRGFGRLSPEDGREIVLAGIDTCIEDPDCLPADVRELYRLAWRGPVCSWRHHVETGRADLSQTLYLRDLSPWQFIKVLGDMLDANVTNTGEGERWLEARRDQDRAAWRKAEDARQARWNRVLGR